MNKTIGTVISLEDSPSTSEFSFVITAKDGVKKGLYVQTENEHGSIFGYIGEVFRANRYYERAESVAAYETFSSMKDALPTDNWNYAVAQVKILGITKDNKFLRSHFPPSPGSVVSIADELLLKKFLGFTEDGLMLGNLQHHEVEARIDLTRLLQKHLAILAMSGAGKSHLSSVLIEELLDRTKEQGRIAIIVIDIHGEYIGFKFDEKYGAVTEIIDGKEMKVPLSKISADNVEEWLAHLSPPQKELLRQAIHDAKEEYETDYGFQELVEKINENKMAKKEVKGPLKRALLGLHRLKFISKDREIPNLSEQVVPGKLLIMDFSTIDNLRKKQILVSMLARKLLRLRKKGKIPPFLLLIEEAHNFAREKAEQSESISRSVIETIAREGRKFGASLCLISQRPVNLSTTALSQCSTHIILRVTNPNDLDHIQMSSEGIDSNVARSITGLKVGEAIIVGEATNHPVFVSVRNRKSIKREKGAPLAEQARQFENTAERKAEQVEAFL